MADELSWVEQVQSMEQSLIDVISQDGDLVVEALSNIPPAARGRLQTMIILAEEVVVQAAHGRQLVIDTGLGTASWYVDSDEDGSQPQQPDPDASSSTVVQSWADVTDPPALVVQPLQEATAVTAATQDQPPQPVTAEVQSTQQPDVVQVADTQAPDSQPPPQPTTDTGPEPVVGPLSKAKTKGGAPAKTPPVKAMPTQVQTQVPPGQPAAKAPTVLTPPPDLSQTRPQPQQPQSSQPTPDPPMAGSFPPAPGQPGTRGVQPVTGQLRQPAPDLTQPQRLTQPFTVDARCLSAFPNDLVGFHSGIYYARVSAVGQHGFLPPTVPYSRAFAPLAANRDARLPASLRHHGHELAGFCLSLCPRCQMQSCSRALTLTSQEAPGTLTMSARAATYQAGASVRLRLC